MTKSLISFGTNQASRKNDLRSTADEALERLRNFSEITIEAVSRPYRTPAFPAGNGPDFLNLVFIIESVRPAHEILGILHAIESNMGRVRKERWAPRICDLDLLLSGSKILPDLDAVRAQMQMSDDEAQQTTPDQLIVPHPRMHRRSFVLVPALDIAASWQHPVTGRTLSDHADELTVEDRASVQFYDQDEPSSTE